MPDIALQTRAAANRAVDMVKKPSHNDQATYVAAEAIAEGAPIRIDTTNGRWTNANGTVVGEAASHIAMHRATAGQSLTGVRRCLLDGYVLDALAYNAPVYVSNTDGRLGDTAGTVSQIVGRVVPGFATTLGTAPDKLLDVQL